MSNRTPPRDARPTAPQSDPLTLVQEAIGRLRFGAIALTVHEGRLVQVEVTEKHRFS